MAGSEKRWPVNLRVGGGGRVLPPPSEVRQTRTYELAVYFLSFLFGLAVGAFSPILENSPIIQIIGFLPAYTFIVVVHIAAYAARGRAIENIDTQTLINSFGAAFLALLICLFLSLVLPFKWRRNPLISLAVLLVSMAAVSVLVYVNCHDRLGNYVCTPRF